MSLGQRFSDRALVRLAWLAPLLLIALTQWRSSLEGPYLPPRVAAADLSLERLEPTLSAWLKATGDDVRGPRMVAVVDTACPCTRPALRALRAMLVNTRGGPVPLVTVDAAVLQHERFGTGFALLAEIPATPTLLVMVDGRLRYAGPITEGGACGVAVRQVVNANHVTAAGVAPLRSVASSGCYCGLKPAAPALRNPS